MKSLNAAMPFPADAKEIFHDVALTLGQRGKGALDLGIEALVHQSLVGVGRVVVDQHVEQAVVFTVHERRVHGDVATGHAERIGNLLARNLEHVGQFVGRRLALILLLELREGFVDLVERSYLVERQTHDTALLGQCLQDRLTDPPHGIGDELEAAGLVELLGGLDQAEVALVDQVGQADALVLVLLGDGDDEPEVRTGEFVEGFLVALLDTLGEFHFLFHGNQFFPTDFLQVFVERGALTVGD